MQPVQAENKTLLYIYDDVTEYGEFDWNAWEYKDSETSAKYFAEKLSEIPEGQTIELHINSNGGSVKEGVAIYNLLKQKQNQKVGIVDGVAHSVAFLILQACDTRKNVFRYNGTDTQYVDVLLGQCNTTEKICR